MKSALAGLAGILLLVGLAVPAWATAQEPVDLFPNVPAVGDDYVRIACWNLRHINLEQGSRTILPGDDDAEDFQSLIATFAQAILDLKLDVVAVVEHQPRTGNPNRLEQLRARLATQSGETWSRDETDIPYPQGESGLQLGLLWRDGRVTIDSSADQLLHELRQPRLANGQPDVNGRMRVPWLIPAQAQNLQFDLVVLHLKSGGGFPQADEVDALEDWIRTRQTQQNPRHLIVLGDWNIRPDQGSGRGRLRQLQVPHAGGHLMRVLTVEEIPPDLTAWQSIAVSGVSDAEASIVPFTHFNANTIDTYLDHIAISMSLDEVFENPIQVELADGTSDLRPGIEIVYPSRPEVVYEDLTDHLPVVLTLRVTEAATPPDTPIGSLRIVAVLPNPPGSDAENEEVHIRNDSQTPEPLDGWLLEDLGGAVWALTNADGTVQPGQTVVVVRNGRSMSLNNSGPEAVVLRHGNQEVHRVAYDGSQGGVLIAFP